MIHAWIAIIACAVAALSFFYYSSRWSAPSEDTNPDLQPLDVDAFLNLIDPQDQVYLREHLPFLVFWRIHRERMFAAMEYCWHAAGNAHALMGLTEMAESAADPAIAAAAEALNAEALNLRVCALSMIVRLAACAFIPNRSVLPGAFASNYEVMSCRFVSFARLQTVAEVARAA